MIPKVELPEGKLNNVEIRKLVKEANFMDSIELFKTGRYVPPGEYTSLYINDNLWMSDTPDEASDHYEAYRKARGECLVAGLGIGLIINAILLKPEVAKVTVIENNPDVIELVGNVYKERFGDRIEIIEADIFTWKPPKDKIYDMVWFDIWEHLCVDNLQEMATLHRKYGRKAKWKGSWGKEILQYEKRRYQY